MRILIFSELFYPHGGGAELATWLYSKLLAEKGFEITIVTKHFPGEPLIESVSSGIRIYRLPMKMTFGSRYDTLVNVGVLLSNFMNRLFSENDIVYIPASWYSAIPMAKIHKKPVVVHLHNYSIACPTSLMYDFTKQKVGSSSLKSFILHEAIERRRGIASVVASSLMNELLGRYYNKWGTLADALIFVSNAQANLVLSKVPQIKEKSRVIYNPIPNIPYIEAESRGLGYFGGKSFVKGFYTLMRALNSLIERNVKVYMTMMSRKRVTVKVGNGILVDFLPKVNLRSIMQKLSVVVIPSLCPEPSPYILIESMMYGKLVVASNVGGIPEIVAPINSGVKLVKPGECGEISEALNSFLTLELEEANEIGIRLRKHILRKFDKDETIKYFINNLDRINRKLSLVFNISLFCNNFLSYICTVLRLSDSQHCALK